jgi:uncharacterized membrane protein
MFERCAASSCTNLAPAILSALAGALVRLWFVARHKGRAPAWTLVVALAIAGVVVVMLVPRPSSEASSFADVKVVLERRCVACHAQNPPPKGVRLDDEARIRAYAPLIRQTVLARAMPPGNLTGMTEEERLLIERWNP